MCRHSKRSIYEKITKQKKRKIVRIETKTIDSNNERRK